MAPGTFRITEGSAGSPTVDCTANDPIRIPITLYEKDEYQREMRAYIYTIKELWGRIDSLEAQIKILSSGGLTQAQDELLRSIINQLEVNGLYSQAVVIRETFEL